MNRYDKAMIFSLENPNLPIVKEYKDVKNIFLKYFDYVELLGLSDEKLNDKEIKEDYIKNTLYLDKNPDSVSPALDQILKSNYSNDTKKAYIEFLYSNIDFKNLPIDDKTLEKYERTYFTKRNEKKEVEIKTVLSKKEVLLSLIKVKINNSKVKIHFDYINKDKLSMFFLVDYGVFLSVGINLDFNDLSNMENVNIGEVIKAIGDPTRFNIIKGLINKDMTSTEISKLVGVSLSTVNYHVKELMQQDIVSLSLTQNESRGGSLSLNKDFLRKILDYVKIKLG